LSGAQPLIAGLSIDADKGFGDAEGECDVVH
jgi:hypothetical protein